MFGQGGLPLGTTAPRQVVSGMTTGVKDGVKVEAKPKVAINASSFQQKNVRVVVILTIQVKMKVQDLRQLQLADKQ